MLSAAQLAHFQAIVVGGFDKTCTISRPGKQMDGKGHSKPTWTVKNGGAIKCALFQPRGQVANAIGGELGSVNQWKLQVPVQVLINGVLTPTDIKMGDRVVSGTNTYHVQNVNSDLSDPVCIDAQVLLIEGSPEDTP